jgi:hypothetical protein
VLAAEHPLQRRVLRGVGVEYEELVRGGDVVGVAG